MSNEILQKSCIEQPNLVYDASMTWITPQQAAKILGIRKSTIYNWGDKGILKMKRSPVLNYRLFDKEDCEAKAKKLPKKRFPGNRVFPIKKRK